MSHRSTLQPWHQLQDMVAQWEEQGESPDLVAMVIDVYEFIDQQKELGASVKDLKVSILESLKVYVQSTLRMRRKWCHGDEGKNENG